MARPSSICRNSPGPLKQQGVAAVYAAFAMVAGVSAMALAVDTGQLYYAQRDLQKLATAAALDATRALSGCYSPAGAPGTLPTITGAVTQSINNNIAKRLVGDIKSASEVTLPLTVPTVEVGTLDKTTTTGVRNFVSTLNSGGVDAGGADSIRVNLARAQPAPLIPFIFSTSSTASAGLLRASASAQQSPMASWHIGSSLANIDTSRSAVLNLVFMTLFGSSGKLALSAASFQALAASTASLGDIAIRLGLVQAGPDGTAGMLLDTALDTPLPVTSILSALADSLAASGQDAAAGAISQLAATVDPGRTSELGMLVGAVDTVGETVAGALPLNTLDLLNALATSAASGLYPLKLAPAVNIPGLVNADVYVTVGEIAQSGSGRAGLKADGTPRSAANTAQVTLMLRQRLNLVGLGTLRLGTDIEVASARSFLSGVRCPMGLTNTPQPVALIDVTTAPVFVAVGSFTDANPAVPVTPGSLLNVNALGIGQVDVSTVGVIPPKQLANTHHEVVPFPGPYPSPETVIGGDVKDLDIGAAVSALVQNLSLKVCVTALIVGQTCQTVTSGVVVSNPLLQLVTTPVFSALSTVTSTLDGTVDGLLLALGAQTGTATVAVEAVAYRNAPPTDTNSVPRLFNLDRADVVTAGTR